MPFCARQLFGGLRRHTSAGMVPARELVSLDDAARRAGSGRVRVMTHGRARHVRRVRR